MTDLSAGQRPGALTALASRVASSRAGLGRATTPYRVIREIPVPMRDGVVLRADLFAPAAPARNTLLMRTPYGRSNLPAVVTAGLYAERGFQVVLQSVRGTFGSGGVFEPGRHEIDDAADTVAWMRTQPWFGGQFATIGSSYLGFTQWALLADPPAELATAVIGMAPHDFAQSGWSTGAFALADFLTWSYQVAHQEDGGTFRVLARSVLTPRRLRRPLHATPLRDAGPAVLAERVPWHQTWLQTPDIGDTYWEPTRLAQALHRVTAPLLLVTGWQDVFLTQTMEQYHTLQGRGVAPALIVGPWTHGDAGGDVVRESLDWLGGKRFSGARVYVTGDGGGWRELPVWPPETAETVYHLQPRARLGPRPAAEPTIARFVYDPADPTPTVGGRLLFTPNGYRDDSALAARGDVVTFTTAVLPAPVEVIGVPRLEVEHRADTGWADVWARISEVGPDGRSQNVSDGFVRRVPGADHVLSLDLDPIAHRFAAGARIRLSIAGGSHPRYARNHGTGEPVWTATRMVPATHEIGADSHLHLPVTGQC